MKDEDSESTMCVQPSVGGSYTVKIKNGHVTFDSASGFIKNTFENHQTRVELIASIIENNNELIVKDSERPSGTRRTGCRARSLGSDDWRFLRAGIRWRMP